MPNSISSRSSWTRSISASISTIRSGPDVARALAYPYPAPYRSFVLDGRRLRFLRHAGDLPDLAGRTPVLAVGSNRAPQQLARKFGPTGGTVPVLRCWLTGFDTVYSAHLSAYGSAPATLIRSPGTRVALALNWLTDAQLARMHETELARGNYAFGRLETVALEGEFGLKVDGPWFYASRHGALNRLGAPVPLAWVPARQRRWPALNQAALQAELRNALARSMGLEAFVSQAIGHAPRRLQRTKRLKRKALSLDLNGIATFIA